METSLTVGACWQSYDQTLRNCEHSEVVECLVQCSESLQLAATNLLEPGMEMVTNSHGSQVTIDGDNVENMNQPAGQTGRLPQQTVRV